MLSVDAVSLVRNDRLLIQGVSFALGPAQALVLTGANGSGKSTLLRTICGLHSPGAGRVCWDRSDIRDDLTQHGTRLAYLAHRNALKAGLTVMESLGGWPRATAAYLPAFLNWPELATTRVEHLSAGQARKLALTRVALSPAPLWVLDEPGNALDSASITVLGAVLARHRAAGGMVIVATHQPLPLPDAATLCLG